VFIERNFGREKQRDNLLEEIVSSERMYSNFLMILTKKFITPVKNRLGSGMAQQLFANLEAIIPFHCMIADELEKTRKVVVSCPQPQRSFINVARHR